MRIIRRSTNPKQHPRKITALTGALCLTTQLSCGHSPAGTINHGFIYSTEAPKGVEEGVKFYAAEGSISIYTDTTLIPEIRTNKKGEKYVKRTIATFLHAEVDKVMVKTKDHPKGIPLEQYEQEHGKQDLQYYYFFFTREGGDWYVANPDASNYAKRPYIGKVGDRPQRLLDGTTAYPGLLMEETIQKEGHNALGVAEPRKVLFYVRDPLDFKVVRTSELEKNIEQVTAHGGPKQSIMYRGSKYSRRTDRAGVMIGK